MYVPAAFFILGAILASFAGVVAGRIHTGQSWVSGRSRCDACAHTLGALDLIPLFSWLSARGRCRACGTRIGAASLFGEAALGGLFVLSYLAFGFSAPLIPFLAALVVLAALVSYDLAHTIVPPVLSAALGACALAYAYLAAPSLHSLLIALGTAFAIALCLGLIHLLSKGRAMGLGDAPVSFSLSLLAAPFALSGIVFSFWIGAVLGILILVGKPKGHRMGVEVPFVPFMAAGYLLAAFTHWNVFPLPWL